MLKYCTQYAHPNNPTACFGCFLFQGCCKVFGTLVLPILVCQVPWSVALNVCERRICAMITEDLDDSVRGV